MVTKMINTEKEESDDDFLGIEDVDFEEEEEDIENDFFDEKAKRELNPGSNINIMSFYNAYCSITSFSYSQSLEESYKFIQCKKEYCNAM